MIRALPLVLLVCGFLGCNEGKSTLDVRGNPNSLPNENALPLPEVLVGRSPRRISVAQLKASFPQVFGNDLNGAPITWMVSSTVTGFTFYGRALGEADFLNVTEESAEVSTLYAKFLDDAARDACARVLNADFARTTASERAFVRHASLTATAEQNPDDINANLRYLRFRFHSRPSSGPDDPTIVRLRKLFSQAVTANAKTATPTKEGWRAVCVSLVTAPEFSLY